jgi:hypothetical protein
VEEACAAIGFGIDNDGVESAVSGDVNLSFAKAHGVGPECVSAVVFVKAMSAATTIAKRATSTMTVNLAVIL